jgi:hypothetical protein
MNQVDRATAIRRLTNRYREQAERFPALRSRMSLEKYISANVEHVMETGVLEAYDRRRDV